jgi:quercetin dioxygenase-like cupin family protein
VVTEGQLTFRWPDHEETYVAGDAYYAPPGHLPLVTAGTSIVEFSPSADLEATMAVVEKNLLSAGAQA